MKKPTGRVNDSDTRRTVTSTTSVRCCKCRESFPAKNMQVPDFREIAARHNRGKRAEEQIGLVLPIHVLEAAECCDCGADGCNYWPLMRSLTIAEQRQSSVAATSQSDRKLADRVFGQTQRIRRSDPEPQVDNAYRNGYRAVMQCSDGPGEYHSLMADRPDRTGREPNGNGKYVARMAQDSWSRLPKGEKISRRARRRHARANRVSYDRLAEQDAQEDMARVRRGSSRD